MAPADIVMVSAGAVPGRKQTMEEIAMNSEKKKINEGFVAGVGLGRNTGFGVGRMTQGLVKHHALLDAFEDRRKDIIFDGQTEEQSITIFPANESAMTIVSARFMSEGGTDRRGHSFCHGMIVDNETFSSEILPYLDRKEFTGQFLTDPEEAMRIGDEDVLRFHPVSGENMLYEDTEVMREEQMKHMYAFALRTVAAEAHYIVQIGELSRKGFLKTLYELLPPPYRYRMESCSCGEYDRMLNVLIAADEPYVTRERFKTRALNQILSEDITERENLYPNIYRIAADRTERKGFYGFLEDNVSYAECRKEMSVQKLQEFLEKKAVEYLSRRGVEAEPECPEETRKEPARLEETRKESEIRGCALGEEETEDDSTFPANREDVQSAKKEQERVQAASGTSDETVAQVISLVDTILSAKKADSDEWDGLRSSLSKLLPECRKEIYASDYDMLMTMSEEDTIHEAMGYLSNRRLKDLADDYILAGNFGAYLEIRNNILKKGVGDMLRSIQQKRLREVLVMGDTDAAMRSNNSRGWNCYLRLVMLAYQMSQEEYDLYQEKLNTDEILYGPYHYKEIERFIRENTNHHKKLLIKLNDLCNPFR